MKLTSYLRLFIMLFFTFQGHNTEVQESVVIGQILTLESNILQEERGILVSLPNGYKENSGISYPVIYLLDGSTHFRYTSGIVKFLSEIGEIPQMIVVGILNTDRMRNFTTPLKDSASDPSSGVHTFPSNGGAERFLAFLESELKPFIKDNFRADSTGIIAGHSSGGLFVIHYMLKKPELFDAYIAVSPSLWWNKEEHLALANEYFTRAGIFKGNLYLAYGGLDGARVSPACINFVKLLKKQNQNALKWKSECLPEEEHRSTPLLSIYKGLLYIFQDWTGNVSPILNESFFKY